MRIKMHRFLEFLPVAAVVVASLCGNAAPVYAGCCEEGTKELFAEYISDYFSSTYPVWVFPLPHCETTTASLIEEFADGDWVRTWYPNSLAWETDWKQTSQGGSDHLFADKSDFGYFCGHGSIGNVQFSTYHFDQRLIPSDTGFGDVDLEWVTFDTAETLRDQANDDWHNHAFSGRLHLLVGWHDKPLQGDTGGEYADDLIDWGVVDGGGDPILTAWFASDGGCTDQDSGITQKVIAEDFANASDHVHDEGFVTSDPVFDNFAFFFKHDC